MGRVLVLLMTLAAVPQPAAGGQTTERVEQAIWLKPRGEIEVEETHVVRFEDGGNRRVTAVVPTPYPAIVAFVSAGLDGTRVNLDDDVDYDTAGPQVVRERGRSLVRWRVSPRAGSRHTFSLSYLLWNGVRQDGRGDVFIWHARPLTARGGIGRADIHVTLSTPLAGAPLITGRAGQVNVERGERTVRVSASPIAPRESLEIRLRFARGSAAGSDRRWQTRRAVRERRTMVVLPLVVSGQIVVLIVHAARRGRAYAASR